MVNTDNQTSGQSHCDCEAKNWDPKKEVDRLLNELDEEETDLKKLQKQPTNVCKP